MAFDEIVIAIAALFRVRLHPSVSAFGRNFPVAVDPFIVGVAEGPMAFDPDVIVGRTLGPCDDDLRCNGQRLIQHDRAIGSRRLGHDDLGGNLSGNGGD